MGEEELRRFSTCILEASARVTICIANLQIVLFDPQFTYVSLSLVFGGSELSNNSVDLRDFIFKNGSRVRHVEKQNLQELTKTRNEITPAGFHSGANLRDTLALH